MDAAGGAKAVADHFGLSYEAVRLWCEEGKVPPKRVLAMEELTGVPRHELNSDVFGTEARA